MARQDSLNILLDTTGKDKLAEVYGDVIENVQKATISGQIKNTALSGDPAGGSVEAKRFENRTSATYGTARAAGKGTAVTAKPVTISINTDKELVTEAEQKDVSLYGVDNFLTRQAALDQKSMVRELEKSFFSAAGTAATAVTPTATTAEGIAEEAIQAVETVSNDFVDGVERDMIHLVCTPAFYGSLRTYIDKVNDGGAKAEEISLFHGVKIHSSVYLPGGVKCIAMAEGSVAQPVMANIIPAQKIPLSNAYAFGLFFSYGTKAVMEDLIMKVNEAAAG